MKNPWKAKPSPEAAAAPADGAAAHPTRPGRSPYDRALAWLSRREYSRLELQQRLLRLGLPEAEVEAVLQRLVAAGWQSDQRFAESRARSKQGQVAVAAIRRELLEHGLDQDTVREQVQALAQDDLAVAQRLWQKKFGQAAVDRAAWARQARFLQSRGFAWEVIRRVVPAPTQRDSGEAEFE